MFVMEKQARLDSPPELRTQAVLYFLLYAMATGNSPPEGVAPPMGIKCVGSVSLILKVEKVLSPGLTTNNIYNYNCPLPREAKRT